MTWRALAIFGVLGTGGLAYYSSERERQLKAIRAPKTIGKAAIGGPFTLHTAANEKYTEQNLLGHWTLIYFGFTMCPDICPAELTKITDALNLLQKRGTKVSSNSDAQISPLFITVDPERDSAERSDEYAKNFHEAFIGLAGSAEDVQKVAKAYRVYYSRDETPGDDYLVDHSIITYLMDPRGEFVEFYGKNASAKEMSSRIEARMLAFK